ncbi:hypothetical protein [Roseomonas rosulenta]|uniref:hypothetical protein n=1 Tax=Roseomonas rosulenta TaxID=2748667 RepID=UPI0018DFC134|nr:hypothetical protein [Roseomonas rosulenta]
MTAHEIAAKRLRAFLDKVGRVPAIGGFVPEAPQHPAAGINFALRGAVSHAREALGALERGDTDAFLSLYQAFRDFQLEAERRQTEEREAAERAEAEAKVEAARQQAEERIEAERAETEAKVQAERRQAEERIADERKKRLQGPQNAGEAARKSYAERNKRIWERVLVLAPTTTRGRNRRLNLSAVAEQLRNEIPDLSNQHTGSITRTIKKIAADKKIDLETLVPTASFSVT